MRETTPAPPSLPPQIGPFVIDTNVLLDAVLSREPWAAGAVRVLAACGHHQVRGAVSVHALATAYYVAAKAIGRVRARAAIHDLTQLVAIVEVGDDDVRYALALPVEDFEDALHVAAALRAGASHVITRDVRGFRHSPIRALSPGDALALLAGR